MSTLKTEAATRLQFILKADPDKWSFLLGNGINRHVFGNPCRWDKLLQEIGHMRSTLTDVECMNHKAFNDIYDLVRQNDIKIPKAELLNLLWKFKGICDDDTSLIELFTLINKENVEQTRDAFLKKLEEFEQPDRDYFKALRDSLIRLDIPVFTTNFDHNIEGAECKKSILPPLSEINKKRNEHREFSARYPWNVCYSNVKKEKADDGYAVWHIHGDSAYISSVQLGVSEYGGSLTRAHNFLHTDAKDDADSKYKTKRKMRFFKDPLSDKWRGYDTWLQPFFTHHLCIIGFGMDKTESFVRWLINERCKYNHFLSENRSKYPDLTPVKNMFIDCEDTINHSKRFYLEKYGFDIITFPSSEYPDFFEDLTKLEK